ncbi:hypothetical protein BFP72_18645 [Reichenbachiella sp. 5M10]|uniref:radical SAM family heme chaperone HemW n=1 Tax=Reichenbachiella sp. 5M10 TaxID=1889772 RepID=UPI000C59059B|nr:radical SAM family heme chaperone HemW [Reichenbachiella sp. 5M10]PIB37284.1 hypothetical protein BFP72_18645 [Reichenbachiella sp. 5M10]
MSGIYIHIPYCKQACYYCDFHFSTRLQNTQQMVDALVSELKLRKDYLTDPLIHTLYFGGGTPSILDTSQLKTIVDAVRTHFVLDPEAELTLEANPDDLTPDKLRALQGIGINRLSIGIQSFDDQILRSFNRSHDRNQALEAVRHAQEIGLTNLSIDLIFGVPDQSLAMLSHDLDTALSLGTPHVSIYGLTIEEDTVFGRWHKQNKLTPIDEELARQHLIHIMDRLQSAGYQQYEISNFAKANHQSKHNSSYWFGTHYLGIGPAAHSYNGHSRQYNIAHNIKYIQGVEEQSLNYELEQLSPTDKITETILTQLRTAQGVNLAQLRAEHDYDVTQVKNKLLTQLVEEKLVLLQNDRLLLTHQGKLLCDSITEGLIP